MILSCLGLTKLQSAFSLENVVNALSMLDETF